MKSLRLLVAVGILTTVTPALAERALVGPERDPDRAFAMSAGGVTASFAIAGAGLALSARSQEAGSTLIAVGLGSLLFTPSLGHSYGQNRIWTTGMKLRVGGMAFAAVALPVAGLLAFFECGDNEERDHGCVATIIGGVGAIGGGLFLAGAIHDVTSVREATRRRNVEGFSARLAPTVVPSPRGRAGAGLGISGSF